MAKKSRPIIKLPFSKKREDPAEWAYDHRVGLFVVIIVYLLVAITFMSAKVFISQNEYYNTIVVDFQDNKPDPMEEIERKRIVDVFNYENVQNVVSNENALNEELKDNIGTNAKEIYDEADAVAGRIRANRENYNRSIGQQLDTSTEEDKGDEDKKTDVKVKGRVTVSFSFTNPVRTSQKLYIPAYRCEGGGEVTVIATLNRNGNVTSASVDKSISSSDRCLCEMAVEAAQKSRFNIDSSAPDRHRGTITYIFIPQ